MRYVEKEIAYDPKQTKVSISTSGMSASYLSLIQVCHGEFLRDFHTETTLRGRIEAVSCRVSN